MIDRKMEKLFDYQNLFQKWHTMPFVSVWSASVGITVLYISVHSILIFSRFSKQLNHCASVSYTTTCRIGTTSSLALSVLPVFRERFWTSFWEEIRRLSRNSYSSMFHSVMSEQNWLWKNSSKSWGKSLRVTGNVHKILKNIHQNNHFTFEQFWKVAWTSFHININTPTTCH